MCVTLWSVDGSAPRILETSPWENDKDSPLSLSLLLIPWDGMAGVGGSLKREGIYVNIQLIHFVVWQKLTQHFKAIILQLKINKTTVIKKK